MQREAALLERVLGGGPSRRILDLGCGTGEHSRFLASRGFEVVAVDRSESMIVSAREEPIPENLEFIEGDICEIEELATGGFGGAICLGNTLPHIRQLEQLNGLLVGLRRRLVSRAPLILQLLNYERILRRGERHLPLNFRSDGQEEIVFLRLMELLENDEILFFPSTLRLTPGQEPPLEVKASKEVRLRGWRAESLETALTEAGFETIELFGDYAGTTFDPEESRDLLVVAR